MGGYLYYGSFIYLLLPCLKEEKECEMVCVLLNFKQYFRSCVTALIIFPSVIALYYQLY